MYEQNIHRFEKPSATNSQQTSTVCGRKIFPAFISARETFVEFASRIVPSFFHMDESHCAIVAVDYQKHIYPDEVCHTRQRKTRDISKIVKLNFTSNLPTLLVGSFHDSAI